MQFCWNDSFSGMERHDSRIGEAGPKMGELVSDGNILVFKELAWPFAGYIKNFRKEL